jgi:hypothetical protein
MADTVPNLWPVEQITLHVQTPLTILRAQAEHLRQLTKDVLRGEVETQRGNDGWVQHWLFLTAPALSFRQRVLLAAHQEEMVYPARLEADCFLPESPTTTMERQPLAATDKEFLDAVAEVFRSRQVRALIQSLLARCNERR